jgi:hypothetical protein
MVAIGLCVLCREHPIPWIPDQDAKPTHCFGTGDTAREGVYGGFYCTCECRNRQPDPYPDRSADF